MPIKRYYVLLWYVDIIFNTQLEGKLLIKYFFNQTNDLLVSSHINYYLQSSSMICTLSTTG